MIVANTQRGRPQADWHQGFLAMLPTIHRDAVIAFRNLQGDDHDEAVQQAIGNACVAYERLFQQGRIEKAFATVLARFAVAQVRAGRQVGNSLRIGEVLSPYAQRNKRFTVERLSRFNRDEGRWIEAVVDDTRTSVFEQVCFRIDFPHWLSRLSPRHRQIAQMLAIGHTTGEVARRFDISSGRVSQLRREFYLSWQEFCGELDETLADASRAEER